MGFRVLQPIKLQIRVHRHILGTVRLNFFKEFGFFSKNVFGIPAAEKSPCRKFVMFAVKIYASGYFSDLILRKNTLR